MMCVNYVSVTSRWGYAMVMRVICSLCSILLLNGCGALRGLPHVSSDTLVNHISENTSNINEAQARANNAIILKNILRARDRWPTSYSTLSGVQSQPQIVFGASATLDPLGLGNPPTPFGRSNATVTQDNTASASYNVNPFAEDNDGQNIYKPVGHEMFKEYWDARYPKDILLMLFVSSITVEQFNLSALRERRQELVAALYQLQTYPEMSSDRARIDGVIAGIRTLLSVEPSQVLYSENRKTLEVLRSLLAKARYFHQEQARTYGEKGIELTHSEQKIFDAKKRELFTIISIFNSIVVNKNYKNDMDGYNIQSNSESFESGSFLEVVAELLSSDTCERFSETNGFRHGCENNRRYRILQTTSEASEEQCPIITAYYSQNLLDAHADSKKTPIEQIQTFSALNDNNLHLQVRPICDSDYYESVVFVRNCKSAKVKDEYKFVRRAFTPKPDHSKQPSASNCWYEYDNLAQGVNYAEGERGDSGSNDDQAKRLPMVGDDRISFKLRSIDSIVYFLGEYIRRGALVNADKLSAEASLNGNDVFPFKVVSSGDCRFRGEEREGVLLFQVTEKGRDRHLKLSPEQDFAVSTSHAGKRYYAVKKLSAEDDQKCYADRSGTVLGILSQLFNRSQSDSFLQAPENTVLRTQ